MTRAKLGLASNGMPWTDMGKQFRGVPKSMRQHDVINVCYWARRLESKLPLNELVKETYVNLSQSVDRVPKAVGHVPCYGPASLMYSLEKDAVISGSGQMMALGWPSSRVSSALMTDAELRDLGGNAYSLCVCAVVQSALALNPFAPWNDDLRGRPS